MRASDDAPAVGSNVHAGDGFVVPFQLVLELEGIAHLPVELDGRVPSYGKGLVVRRERVVGNGVVEQVVDFGGSHVR